jgi:ADP-glucose pyrophosphorylase
MKRIAVWSAAVFTVWAIAAQTQSESHQEAQKVFRGEVSDSQCALNIHSLTRSHQEMLKSKSMGGTATSCSLYCIKNLGGEFVLAAGKTVYRIDKQDAIREFAGQKAKITGALDPKTNTIHVEKVEVEVQR